MNSAPAASASTNSEMAASGVVASCSSAMLSTSTAQETCNRVCSPELVVCSPELIVHNFGFPSEHSLRRRTQQGPFPVVLVSEHSLRRRTQQTLGNFVFVSEHSLRRRTHQTVALSSSDVRHHAYQSTSMSSFHWSSWHHAYQSTSMCSTSSSDLRSECCYPSDCCRRHRRHRNHQHSLSSVCRYVSSGKSRARCECVRSASRLVVLA